VVVVRLDPLTAALYGGHHRGAITMRLRVARRPSFAVASQLEKVDANRLASATTNLRGRHLRCDRHEGPVVVQRRRLEAIARSLNGTFSLNLAEGRLGNVNLSQEIARLAKFHHRQARTLTTSTRVAGLTGTLQRRERAGHDVRFSRRRSKAALLAQPGTINLVDQSVEPAV
jgi:hypothetical protein